MLEPQGLTKRHEEKEKTAAPVVGVGGKGATLSASVCQHALHVRTSLHAKRLAAFECAYILSSCFLLALGEFLRSVGTWMCDKQYFPSLWPCNGNNNKPPTRTRITSSFGSTGSFVVTVSLRNSTLLIIPCLGLLSSYSRGTDYKNRSRTGDFSSSLKARILCILCLVSVFDVCEQEMPMI